MKPKFEKTGTLLELIMFFKIYIDRSKGYMNVFYALFMGIAALNTTLDKEGLQDTWLISIMNDNLFITYIIFFAVGICVLLGIGFLDTSLGARSEEMRNNSLHNPVTRRIDSRVKENNEILKELINNEYV